MISQFKEIFVTLACINWTSVYPFTQKLVPRIFGLDDRKRSLTMTSNDWSCCNSLDSSHVNIIFLSSPLKLLGHWNHALPRWLMVFMKSTTELPYLILIQGPSWSYGSWIYNYPCNQFLSPLTLWVQNPVYDGWLMGV